MKRFGFIIVIGAILSAACITQPTETPSPSSTNTSQPTLAPIPIPPTPAFKLIDLKSGGFSLSVHSDLEFDIDDYSINLSDQSGELVISLNGRPYIASNYTLESFLGKYVAEIAARGGTLIPSTPYEIVIDGINGIAVDLTGFFLDNPVAGKAIIISPGKDFVVFGLGMSNLSAHENSWAEKGSVIFEMLVESVKFNEDVK